MKKFLLFTLIFTLLLSSVSAFAFPDVSVAIDGETIVCKNASGEVVHPILQDGTTYLPVRAIAEFLSLDIAWDDATKSVFINGNPENAQLAEHVNIFIGGNLFQAHDALGNVVYPVLQDGTTYLPIRAVGEAFGYSVFWDDATKTANLFSSLGDVVIEEGKVYAFVNCASGKAISVTDKGLETKKFDYFDYQGFKISPSDSDGYYYITSLVNDKNFDVNSNSKNAGASIITYNKGTADNQKFALEKTEDGYLIYALSSLLPIEDSAGLVKQNDKRESPVQKWQIVELSLTHTKEDTFYRLSACGFNLLNSDSLSADNSASDDFSDEYAWILSPDKNAEYIITNKSTDKSLDVANNSKTSNDPVITYKTSGDANQRWTFEKQSDGTYLIKSVHSSLYLSLDSDNNVIQSELNPSLKQNWTISVF